MYGILTQDELRLLRHRDPLEVYRMERRLLRQLEGTGQYVQWCQYEKFGRPYFIHGPKLPCYICLEWIDAIWFSNSDLAGVSTRPTLEYERARLRECIPCKFGAGRYGKGEMCSRNWRTCRNCGRVSWARVEPCPEVGHKTLLPYSEKELTCFCVECAGSEFENMGDLITKYCPSSGEAQSHRRVQMLKLGRQKRAAWERSPPPLRERDLDPLASALESLNLSDAFDVDSLQSSSRTLSTEMKLTPDANLAAKAVAFETDIGHSPTSEDYNAMKRLLTDIVQIEGLEICRFGDRRFR